MQGFFYIFQKLKYSFIENYTIIRTYNIDVANEYA